MPSCHRIRRCALGLGKMSNRSIGSVAVGLTNEYIGHGALTRLLTEILLNVASVSTFIKPADTKVSNCHHWFKGMTNSMIPMSALG